MSSRATHRHRSFGHLALGAAALCLGLSICSTSALAESPDDILVIVNNGVGISSLSQAEIQSLFLKVRTAFPGTGKKVVPLHAKDGSTLRTEFQNRILDMSPEQEGRYWQVQKIKVGIDRPAEFGNPQMAVFKLSGGISYVFRKDFKEGVSTVVAVFPKK